MSTKPHGYDDSIGWDLRSAESIPQEGLREFFDQIKVTLRNRATGEIRSATAKSHSPWLAICFAIREITGIHADDQQLAHDSLLLFASSAMIDVNRKLLADAKKKEADKEERRKLLAESEKKPRQEFDWPIDGSLSDGGRRDGFQKARISKRTPNMQPVSVP